MLYTWNIILEINYTSIKLLLKRIISNIMSKCHDRLQTLRYFKSTYSFKFPTAYLNPALISLIKKVTTTKLTTHNRQLKQKSITKYYLLLWMINFSSFLLAAALSTIFWSIVFAVTRRYTTTGLVWPILWHLSWAWRSDWGFLKVKKKNI